MALHSTVQKHLNDTRDSLTADRQLNNAFARKITLLLFLSRLLIFKYYDLFNELFRKLRRLVDHHDRYLSDYVSDAFEDVKDALLDVDAYQRSRITPAS
ncbi:MAG: hypothetical protein BYD32DRAFT_464032 [Podila humilis]|nr:MAG: hypothetical protein BYD32DRAFT_464032 [Podila humilis]